MRRETLLFFVLRSAYTVVSHYPVPSSAAADTLIYDVYNNS
jgi:hypothetical protein